MTEELRAHLRRRWNECLDTYQLRGAFQNVDPLAGKILRPLVMQYSATAAGVHTGQIIDAALAIQLVHTASLLHDDILDDAASRRGTGTLSAKERLLLGDLLITLSYQLAAPLPDAGPRYATAVHRMAVGEAGQGAAGSRLDYETYRRLITEKSGALFGWALQTPWLLAGRKDEAILAAQLGDRLGAVYQLLDDVLDWCPHTDTGKPALQDVRQGKRTLPTFEFRGRLTGSVAQQVADVFADGAMARATARIEHECYHWTRDANAWLGANAEPLCQMVETFADTARDAYEENEELILNQEKIYA